MGKFGLLAIGGAMCSAMVLAQEPKGFDGRWGGSFVAPGGGMTLVVELIVNGASGTWQIFPNGIQAREFPCLLPRHAVTVRHRSATELRFTIDASQTLRGCQDGRAALWLVDDQHLEGRFGDGRELKLTRK